MSINYIQFHIGDFLSGVMHMDGAEVGAYTMLLMAHYQAGEQGIPDDDRKLRQICKITTRAWATVKETVLEKFYLEDGHWKHERVIEEIRKIRAKAGSGRPNSADEKQLRETLNDIQKPISVNIKKNNPLILNETEKTNQEPITSINNPPCSPPKGGRGDRLEIFMGRAYPTHPDGLPSDWGEWAEGKGLNPEQIIHHWQKFLNYWRAKTGSNATKRDWYATWQNWILTELERGTK